MGLGVQLASVATFLASLVAWLLRSGAAFRWEEDHIATLFSSDEYLKYVASSIVTGSSVRVCAPRVADDVRLTPQKFAELRRDGQPIIIPFRSAGIPIAPTSLDRLRERFPPVTRQLGRTLPDIGVWLEHISADLPFDLERKIPVAQAMGPAECELLLGGQQPLRGLTPSSFQPAKLWLGVSSYFTPIHSDPADNFVLMLSGTKNFWISPPDSHTALHPRCVCIYPAHTRCAEEQCWASVQKPLENAPPATISEDNDDSAGRDLMRSIPAANLTLRASEMLYLPAGWFHYVRNEGPTVMVNFWANGIDRAAAVR